MTEEKKMYTIEEICDLLHVTRRTTYSWIKSGKLRANKIGKRWLITEKQLTDFISASEK